MKYSLIYIAFWSCLSCFSQNKTEKEERITYALFPDASKPCFNTIIDQVKSLKFYKETNNKHESYEAKFKFNKQYYSIEFNSMGKLEDIEVTIKKKQVPKNVLQKIQSYNKTHYDKIRFIKIQKQFVNNTTKNDKQFIEYILNNPETLNSNFEIIAEVVNKEIHVIKEFTFKNDGEFKTSRIVESEDYEHVLY